MKRVFWLFLYIIPLPLMLMSKTRIFKPKEIPINHISDLPSDIHFLTIDGDSASINLQPSLDTTLRIEGTKKGSENDIGQAELAITINDKTIAIKTVKRNENNKAKFIFTVLVPHQIQALTMRSKAGDVKINEVRGGLTVNVDNGKIAILGASSHVTARTKHGSIYLDHRGLSPQTKIDVETEYGHIDLVIPEKTSARLDAQTQKGTVTSPFSVTTDSITHALNKQYWQLIKEQVHGTIGIPSLSEGQPRITLTIKNKGYITIKSK